MYFGYTWLFSVKKTSAFDNSEEAIEELQRMQKQKISELKVDELKFDDVIIKLQSYDMQHNKNIDFIY